MPDITYRQLQRTVATFSKDVMQHSGMVRADAQSVDREATDTARDAEVIASLGVDSATVAETHELARVAADVSQAATAYAAAGNTTGKAAQAAGAQATASHGGIHEAYNRSTVDISRMKPEWLTQE